MNKRTFGSSSEQLAIKYLKSEGYLFLDRNNYFKGGEIDIIMQEDDFIVFVEVKSLGADRIITIYETLSQTKKRRLRNSINKWLLKNNKLETPWRLDFVGIVYDNTGGYEIEHFKFIDIN